MLGRLRAIECCQFSSRTVTVGMKVNSKCANMAVQRIIMQEVAGIANGALQALGIAKLAIHGLHHQYLSDYRP